MQFDHNSGEFVFDSFERRAMGYPKLEFPERQPFNTAEEIAFRMSVRLEQLTDMDLASMPNGARKLGLTERREFDMDLLRVLITQMAIFTTKELSLEADPDKFLRGLTDGD